MKTGLDLDGVVIRDPLGLTRSRIIGTFLNDYFFSTWLGKTWYRSRQPNDEVIACMKNRKGRGEEVIIISGTFQHHRALLQNWLSLHKALYDGLWLRGRVGESLLEFKVKILKETGCRFYLEDNTALAQKIKTSSGSQVRTRKWKNLVVIKLK